MEQDHYYHPGDDVVIGFDDAVAADNALDGPVDSQFQLPTQSSSSEEEDDDNRRVVGLANNISQFQRGTQKSPPLRPRRLDLTQGTNDAAGALLGLVGGAVIAAPAAPVAVIEEEDQELQREQESIINKAPDLSQQKSTGEEQRLTDAETMAFSAALVERRPVFSITTDQDANVLISHQRSEDATATSETAKWAA